MAPNDRLNVLRIWRALFAVMETKARPLGRALVIPAFAMAAVETGTQLLEGPSSLLLLIPYVLFAAMFAVSTHRIVLLEDNKVALPGFVWVERFG